METCDNRSSWYESGKGGEVGQRRIVTGQVGKKMTTVDRWDRNV